MNETLKTAERIRLRLLIDQELDRLYGPASDLGKWMGAAFRQDAKSQLRNLESIAAAATRTSSLKNHVKNQTGKDRERREDRRTWALPQDGKTLGERVLALLDDLAAGSAKLVRTLPYRGNDEDVRELARVVELELQRGVVQTAVCAALHAEVME